MLMARPENMNMMDRDLQQRAAEVLEDLCEDGYPSDAQWRILCMALGAVVASDLLDEEHLREGVEITKGAIEWCCKVAFRLNNGGGAPR
jgi:hypothetical protein